MFVVHYGTVVTALAHLSWETVDHSCSHMSRTSHDYPVLDTSIPTPQ